MEIKTVEALGYTWLLGPENFITKRARILLEIRFSRWVEANTTSELEKEALTSLSHLYYDILSITRKLTKGKEDCQALLNTWVKEPELWIGFVSGLGSDDDLYALEAAAQELNPHWYAGLKDNAEEIAEAVEQAVEGKGDAMAAAKAVGELQDKREAEAEKNG